jgi:Transposase.
MGKGIRYSDEFKQEAVNQVSVHDYSVAEVSERLGISTKSLYDWLKHFSKPTEKREEEQARKDWQNQHFNKVVGDEDEFIPLP